MSLKSSTLAGKELILTWPIVRDQLYEEAIRLLAHDIDMKALLLPLVQMVGPHLCWL